MRNLPVFMFGLLLIGGLSSCQKEEVGLTDDDILQSNKSDILDYAARKSLGGSMTATGVYYALSKASGSTVMPAYGQEVEFNYKLYLLSRNSANAVIETFVDSTYATKSSYIYLVENTPGVTEGLLKMSEGAQAYVLLPSVYAFGRTGAGNGVIPANAPVRLDVTLKRARTEDQQINEYLTANKLTPTEVTQSGLRFVRTLTNSTGVSPTPTQTLTIKYRGQLIRATALLPAGTAFDSTGTGTYSSLVTQFKPGFAEGLAKLRVGEKATIIFPSKLGYGNEGALNNAGDRIIPAYAPLRFDIELVSAQ